MKVHLKVTLLKKALSRFDLDGVSCVATSIDGRFIIAGEAGTFKKKDLGSKIKEMPKSKLSIKIFAIKDGKEVHHFEEVHRSKPKFQK